MEATLAALQQNIDAALTKTPGAEVMCDLAGAKIDSRTLGSLLLEADRLSRHGGKLKLVNVPDGVLELMRLVGVEHMLGVGKNGLATSP